LHIAAVNVTCRNSWLGRFDSPITATDILLASADTGAGSFLFDHYPARHPKGAGQG
jgi:hypothetical protein